MDNLILKLYSQPGTVFTISEIAQLLPGVSDESLRDKLYYFSKTGKLKRLRHGIYAKEGYNPFELANRIYTPSYISLETVLVGAGVVFQYYETIFLMSYLSRHMEVDGRRIQYRQLKSEILINTAGIEQKEGYFTASVERAFLDAIYVYKNYHFDNLGVLDWDKVADLKKIYRSKALEKRSTAYYKIYQEEYGKH